MKQQVEQLRGVIEKEVRNGAIIDIFSMFVVEESLSELEKPTKKSNPSLKSPKTSSRKNKEDEIGSSDSSYSIKKKKKK